MFGTHRGHAMFGLSRDEVHGMIQRAFGVLQDNMDEAKREMESRIRQIGAPPSSRDLAREALQHITSQVDPREFLQNLLLTKGLTVEGLVKASVREVLAEGDVSLNAVKDLVEKAWDEFDLDRHYGDVADRITEKLLSDPVLRKELIKEVAEKVAENFDLPEDEEFYASVGRILVDRATKANGGSTES